MTHDPSEMTKCTQARVSILSSLPTHPSILLISSLRSLSCAGEGSLISPLEASIQRLVRLSTDITNFTFHPFSASNEAMTTASRRVPHSSSLPDLLRYYPVFFFRGEDPALDSFWFYWQPNVIIRAVYANSDKMINSKAGWVSRDYSKHRSSDG